MQLDSAAHGINDAGKFDQQPVTGRLDDTPAMLGYFGMGELAPDRL
jgi:hypothetical protein